MTYGTGVTEVTLTKPSAPYVAPFPTERRSNLAMKSSLTVPPSPLQVHVGGRSASLQVIDPPTSLQSPLSVLISAMTFSAEGGDHVKVLTKPMWLTFVISTW